MTISLRSTTRRCTASIVPGGRLLRGLLAGALAVAALVAPSGDARAAAAAAGAEGARATGAASTIAIRDGRIRGELHGVRTADAIAELASLLGARLFWSPPAAGAIVRGPLTGLTVEQALSRLLGDRSYLLILGRHPEIHVLSGDQEDPGADAASVALAPRDDELEMARFGRIAEIDRIAAAEGEAGDAAADLEAIVRGDDESTVRLAAAERLLALDPEGAPGALAWLTTDADPGVRRRAEALLATTR